MTNTIGKRIKKLRNENGYTQKQVADYLGFEQIQIIKLENDDVALKSSTLNKLCELYGCMLEYILEGNGEYSMEKFEFPSNKNNLDLHTLSKMNRIIGNLKQLNEMNGLK